MAAKIRLFEALFGKMIYWYGFKEIVAEKG